MNKLINIKLDKLDIYDFCDACGSFKSSIDFIDDGSHVLNAKEYHAIIFIDTSKVYTVSINSNDENEILRFNRIMKKYSI